MGRPSTTHERRDDIIRGLRRVMARSGYDGASVGEIARAAGVAPGIVHYHFRDKREILLGLLAALIAEHESALDARIAAAKADPSRELDAFLDAHLATGKTADPEALACWVALCGEAIKDRKVGEAYARALEGTQRRLLAIVRRGAASGAFTIRAKRSRHSGDAAESAAAAIASLVQGYLVLAATARTLIPRGTAAGAARAMADGLLSRRTKKGARA